MKSNHFAICALFISMLTLGSNLRAEQKAVLIFEDDFDRNESQEAVDEVGNGWATNSNGRAAGNKQVDLRDGVMHIYIHKAADHAVSVTHPAEFQDGSVEIKFMLEDEKDSLGLNFADLEYKKVHAGHLCKATIGTKFVEIADLKTGVMDLKTRELRQANQVSPELQALLKTKSTRVPHKMQTGKWYTAVVEIDGDTLAVSIDGGEVAKFSSEGIAHPTKRMLRLSIPQNVVVDDLRIYSLEL